MGKLKSMNQSDIQRLRDAIDLALDKAERKWADGGYSLEKAAIEERFSIYANDEKPSNIPGHPYVRDDGQVIVEEFIALVADMRDSSKHLQSVTSHKNADVSDIQRVFYETSALLPALSISISLEGGSVTEYLGDGVLALFKIDENNPNEAIYGSRRAANNIIGATRSIVNEKLREKYRLPEIDIGVGLAYSKAMVTLVGAEADKQPKVFGECVFRATKLSTGRNQVYTDKILRHKWPKSKGGKLEFRHKRFGDIDGYQIL